MVRLGALPNQAIIGGFKGKIDFYLWKGIPCARRWPRWRKRKASPAEAAAQEAFAYINQMAAFIPTFIRAQYVRQVTGTPFSWKDLLVKAYISGITY